MLSSQPLPRLLPPLNGAGDKARAIVSTLLYYDLFCFAPNSTELVRFAHRGGADGHYGPADLTAESPWWSSQAGHWFLKGRGHLLSLRQDMLRASTWKLGKARRLARLLQIVPGVRFVGVTGSLSMESSLLGDDIDLLIITARDRLWLTRAFVLTLLLALGVKRPDDGNAVHPDQVCTNIFLSENDLAIPDRNLFIAHEICQMLPLAGRPAYRRFLAANQWVKEFLPQWEPPRTTWEDRGSLRLAQRLGEALLGGDIRGFLEKRVMTRQLARIKGKHARGHNTGVRLSDTQLRFHPRDLSGQVLGAFDSRWASIQPSGLPAELLERSFVKAPESVPV